MFPHLRIPRLSLSLYSDAFDDMMTPRRWLQRERGLCSDLECDEPIAGWCATCDAGGPFKAPKWCEWHLSAHLAREHHLGYWLYRGPATPGGAA
jgi:hypothetical protein